MKKNIVIIGGGYAGLKVLEGIVDREDISITLIDRNSYHYIQPEAYDFIANKYDISQVCVCLYTYCSSFDNVCFLKHKVQSVDFNRKIVRGEDNLPLVNYDYLVLTVGAKTFFPKQIPELMTYSRGIKSLHRSLEFKQKFEFDIFEKIKNEEGSCALEESYSIVVAGGGLSGIEIAAEMAHYSKEYFKKEGFACDRLEVTLIAPSGVLKGMDTFLRENTQKRLESLGVRIVTGDRVAEVNEEEVTLQSGRKLSTHFMIWTGGIIARGLTTRLKEVQLNKKFQIEVDETLRVKGHCNVFAAGDCAQITNSDGKFAPQTAQTAINSGKHVAKSLKALLDNKPLARVDFPSKGTLIALGGRYAVGMVYDKIKLKGLSAFLLKHAVFYLYKHPLKRVTRKIRKERK